MIARHSESFCAKGASAFGGGYAQDKRREESAFSPPSTIDSSRRSETYNDTDFS
jgi:hypothetical protein